MKNISWSTIFLSVLASIVTTLMIRSCSTVQTNTPDKELTVQGMLTAYTGKEWPESHTLQWVEMDSAFTRQQFWTLDAISSFLKDSLIQEGRTYQNDSGDAFVISNYSPNDYGTFSITAFYPSAVCTTVLSVDMDLFWSPSSGLRSIQIRGRAVAMAEEETRVTNWDKDVAQGYMNILVARLMEAIAESVPNGTEIPGYRDVSG